MRVISGWMWLRLLLCGSSGALILLSLPHVVSLHTVYRLTAPWRLSPCGSYLWLRVSHTLLCLRRLVCMSLSTLVVLWLPNLVSLHTVSLPPVRRLPAPGRLFACCSYLWWWALHARAIF
jgi:hypothetical protein